MKNGIGFAKKDDIPFLYDIWKAGFPDSDEYIKCFYERNFERMKVLVYYADGKPVCMINMLSAVFRNGESVKNAEYMYAGATLPEYRKKGYFRALTEYLTGYAVKEDCALFCKPALKERVAYYESFGFKRDACFRLVTVHPERNAPLSFTDIDYKEYNRMRNKAFSDIPYGEWSDEHIRWCLEDNEFYDGRTVKISLSGKEYFLMAYPQDSELIITETDLSLDELKELSGSLCDLFGTELIKAYMPDSYKEGESIDSSIVYNAPLLNTYVNLILI